MAIVALTLHYLCIIASTRSYIDILCLDGFDIKRRANRATDRILRNDAVSSQLIQRT